MAGATERPRQMPQIADNHSSQKTNGGGMGVRQADECDHGPRDSQIHDQASNSRREKPDKPLNGFGLKHAQVTLPVTISADALAKGPPLSISASNRS
jgi:hypothetical protein